MKGVSRIRMSVFTPFPDILANSKMLHVSGVWYTEDLGKSSILGIHVVSGRKEGLPSNVRDRI